jgi:hypothetical protein
LTRARFGKGRPWRRREFERSVAHLREIVYNSV